MFGNVDKKFEKIGFVKVSEDKYGASYFKNTCESDCGVPVLKGGN